MVRIIGESEKLQAKEAGGKAAQLNYLKSKGLPVPSGIILENEYFTSGEKEEFLSLLDPKKLYAVRSSALDEDGADHSFAGLQDTHLNVVYDDILDKVKACYQSQFNERAREYRKSFGIEESRGMTVIVQEMVDADHAGVIFTQNPLNNRIDQIVIELVEGLGEKLVSGLVTLSTYTVSKDDPSDFELKEHGARLKQEEIRELARYASLIESMYEGPQDIEFAIKDDKVYILQSRPITTITRVPAQQREGLRLYLSFAHAQNMMYPVTPAGAEMVQTMFDTQSSRFLKGRILYNGAFLFIDISELLLTPDFIYKKVMKALGNINFNLPQLADRYRSMNKDRKLLPIGLLKFETKMAGRVVRNLASKKVSNNKIIEFMEEHVTRFENYSDEQLLANQNKVAAPLFQNAIPYILSGVIAFFRLKKLFEKWDLDMTDFNKLVSGLDGNVTSEMGLLYDDMLMHYGTDKGDKLFDEYMERFAMRTDGEIDIGRSRPADDPESFRLKVKKQSAVHNGESLRAKHDEQLREADRVVRELETKLSPRQFKKFSHWLRLLRNYYVLREHPKYMIVRIFEKYRRLIDTPFETFQEKSQGGCDPQIIEERRVRYEKAKDRPIPIAMLSNGLILRPAPMHNEGCIQGFGVSSGKVTARVRVIRSIDEDILQAGEILATRFTDPGWTPTLSKASGIITEAGGMMTHGAIVAREYGIPAVVGIENVTDILKTGDMITMDGDSGTIVIEKDLNWKQDKGTFPLS